MPKSDSDGLADRWVGCSDRATRSCKRWLSYEDSVSRRDVAEIVKRRRYQLQRTSRPGAWLVNIARGALVDTEAALAHLNTGHLAGIGLDVFPTEPYPADGPLLAHPHVVATAHTASLTSDYFAAASRRLGEALAAYLSYQPPAGLLRIP